MEVVEDTSINEDHIVSKGSQPHPHVKVQHEGKTLNVDLVSLAAVVDQHVIHNLETKTKQLEKINNDIEDLSDFVDVVRAFRDFFSHPFWGKLKYLLIGLSGGGGWALFVVNL